MVHATYPFRIYNASAGSGKTYTLTREYLRILLSQYRSHPFRRILAITFTNKAVGELKSRILDTLEDFSKKTAPQERSDMFTSLCRDLSIDAAELQQRSARLLQEILHNYAFFDVSTIDKFNHRILRTFSRDLQLPAGFEVITDTDTLLRRAVDALVQQAGRDSLLTEIMLEFALEKTDEDRHWDLSMDLMDMGKQLFNENDLPYLEIFRGKSISDFLALRKLLDQKAAASEKTARTAALELITLLSDHDLETTDFNRGYLPKFLQKIVDEEYDTKLEAGWLVYFREKTHYIKATPDHKKEIIEALHLTLAEGVETIRGQLYHRAFLRNARKNIAPFTLLGLLRLELDKIQEAESLLPVAHFNAIIAGELAEQPAAYIYERLGEKYRYYFIDEFQDTSLLQWQNLIPLISNALSGADEEGRQGGLILVGDAKQAIYRWRGGRAEQFMGLSSHTYNPFPMEARIESLPRNYRSRETLVTFNNELFTHLGAGLSRETHSLLFTESSRQESHSEATGLVRLEFLEADGDDLKRAYALRSVEILTELQQAGYPWRDVCILTRRKKEGILVSEALAEACIPMVSSETLLLENHPTVRFLMALLRHLRDPADPNPAFDLLYYLVPDDTDPHGWVQGHLQNVQKLLEERYGFVAGEAAVLPVYDILEQAIACFRLGGDAAAYLVFLLDLVLEIGMAGDASIGTFLEHWELKKKDASLKAPENQNAVRLMTIHQAKGLEFPIVLYPFADSPVSGFRQGKLWVPVPREQYGGFSYLQIGKRKDVPQYGSQAAACYLEEQENTQLDAYNILYVAHTRAEKALFVLSKNPSAKSSSGQTYADLYQGYLEQKGLWRSEQMSYGFGQLPPAEEVDDLPDTTALPFRYSGKEALPLHMITRSGQEWATGIGEALSIGNLIHYAMSMIHTRADLPAAIQRLLREGALRESQEERMEKVLTQITEHPDLTGYFDAGWKVYNERELLIRKAVFLRPDRLQVRGRSAVLIDYKTGQPRPEHRDQLQEYQEVVSRMGFEVERAILVYINQEQVIIEER